MRIKLLQDSRDLHAFEYFGQIVPSEFPLSKNFDDPNIPEKIQLPGNVECLAYSVAYIAQNRTKKEYDIDELFNRVPHTNQGANVRDVFREAVTNGLKVKGANTYEKPFSSYWRADTSTTGLIDAFDASRSAQIQTESPLIITTSWYREWLNLQPNSVMPVGKTIVSGHAYIDMGWVADTIVVNGQPMFVIEFWGGYKLRMPRETFNKAVGALGCGAWVMSTVEIDGKRNKEKLQKVVDFLVNLWLAFQDWFNFRAEINKPVPVSVINTVNKDYQDIKNVLTTMQNETPMKIVNWAKGIEQLEGGPARMNNNPGNLKFSGLTQSWGAVLGSKASDGGNFAKFATYEAGFNALCQFLILGCKDELKDYHKARTFGQFTKIYAGNPPQGYIDSIAKIIGCSLNTNISTFLT